MFEEHAEFFQCPLCSRPVGVLHPRSLVCSRGHRFDFARNGYINLVARPVRSGVYTRQMFSSRQALHRRGFFQPLIDALAELSTGWMWMLPASVIFDAGCGDGSNLAALTEVLRRAGHDCTAIGMDLSKEAVYLAAREYPGSMWCAADLARCPLTSYSIDLILNILSPSSYREFQRLLKPGGLLLKVIPNAGHLRELRQVIETKAPGEYSNAQVRERFAGNFPLITERRVRYVRELEDDEYALLAAMTPLAADQEWDAIAAEMQSAAASVTFDMTVLVGRRSCEKANSGRE